MFVTINEGKNISHLYFWSRDVEHDWLVVWLVVDITGGGVDEDGPPVGPETRI